MIIGDNIKKHRKLKGLTQVQLAKVINKSESTIQKYESNSVTPDLAVLNDISEALNCNLFDLTMDTDMLKNDVRVIECSKPVISIAKKYGFEIQEEYDNNSDGEYLRYVYISFSDKKFRLTGTEFYKLISRINDSIITNILASENYDLLK